MLYYIIRPIVRLALMVYFRKIFFTNERRIPTGMPLMFAVNHPTSFIDPILLACFSSRVFHFILRGDVYRSPKIVQWALRSINCIPIYRSSEGFNNVKKNHQTFEYCHELWHAGAGIQVLVEGRTKHEKRLRPIAKGPARMILGYFEKYGDDQFAIVPVGVNYSDSDQFRSFVYVDFGNPIPLKDFIEAYRENDRKAIRQITLAIEKGLRARVIHVEDPADDTFVNQLLDLHRNAQKIPRFPLVERQNDAFFKSEWALTEWVNQLPEPRKNTLKKQVADYFRDLKTHGISDFGVARPDRASVANALFLVLGFLPFLAGFIFHFLPLWGAVKIADKTVRKIEFHASVRIGAGVALGLVYYLLWLVALLFAGGISWACWLLVAPFVGMFAVIWYDLWSEFRAALAFNRLPKSTRVALQNARQSILNACSKNPQGISV